MSMWLQWDIVAGVAHSVKREDTRAHAESGTGPSPIKLKTTAKMSVFLTISKVYQSFALPVQAMDITQSILTRNIVL
jgi:hypothetical protein